MLYPIKSHFLGPIPANLWQISLIEGNRSWSFPESLDAFQSWSKIGLFQKKEVRSWQRSFSASPAPSPLFPAVLLFCLRGVCLFKALIFLLYRPRAHSKARGFLFWGPLPRHLVWNIMRNLVWEKNDVHRCRCTPF